MRRHAIPAISLTLLALVGVSGCAGSPGSSGTPDAVSTPAIYPGLPTNAPGQPSTDFEPFAVITDDSSLAITLYGSSSCAPGVDEADTSSWSFAFSVDAEAMCTADIAPTTYDFPISDESAVPDSVSVSVTTGFDTTTTDVAVTK